jgi:preprotein translocase subunit Sec63
MRVYGKVFGAIIGWLLLRHPIGMVVGGLLGHVLDAGWLRTQKPDSELDRAYRTLAIDQTASSEAIDQAYRRQMAQYHPDKVAGAAEEIRQLAEERASAINAAYDTVMAARRRAGSGSQSE